MAASTDPGTSSQAKWPASCFSTIEPAMRAAVRWFALGSMGECGTLIVHPRCTPQPNLEPISDTDCGDDDTVPLPVAYGGLPLIAASAGYAARRRRSRSRIASSDLDA